MNLVPILRTQSELLAEYRRRLRDPQSDNPRWNSTEIYDAINLALSAWHGRVQIPRYYDFDFVSGTYEYTLPDYIQTANLDLQSKHIVWGLNAATEEEWQLVYSDVPAWYVVADSTGGQTLVVENSLSTVDGRLIWWDYNGPIPTTIPTVGTEIDSDDTSVVLATVVTDIGRAGYVKIGSEWMGYAGVSDDGSNTTLANLTRGLSGTTAATHAASSQVQFGIAAPDARLWEQLFNQVASHLHVLFLSNGSPSETEHHERILGLHENRAMEFWKTWTPVRPPKMKLSRRGIGEIAI